jgi:Flp pilus assembly pilin Flp
MIRRFFSRLLRDEQGQDLTEYTLLIAMVALAAVGIFSSAGQSASGVWRGAGTILTSASSISTGAAAPATGDRGSDQHR